MEMNISNHLDSFDFETTNKLEKEIKTLKEEIKSKKREMKFKKKRLKELYEAEYYDEVNKNDN